MSNGDKRADFSTTLIAHLDKYIQGGLLSLLLEPYHKTLALKMKLEAKHYLNNPTDENWMLFVCNLRAFHQTLQEQKSESLLKAINHFIDTSLFPDIINVFMDVDQLNIRAHEFQKELSIDKPSAEFVIPDFIRHLPLSIAIGKSTPMELDRFFEIKTDDETNECVIKSILTEAVVYQGVPNTPEEAAIALKAIAHEINRDMDKNKKDMLNKIVPFMGQNGVLEQGMTDSMALLQETLSKNSRLPQDATVTIDSPSHSVVLSLSNTSALITETYCFEKCKITDANGEVHEHPFTTPIKVVEQFECEVAENGETAVIKKRKIEFSAHHEGPKLKAESNKL